MKARRSRWRLAIAAALVVATSACGGHASSQATAATGLGRPANATELATNDIDVDPSGANLPAGRGTAREGERIFAARCATCHAASGIALAGGVGSIASGDPRRTVASYWPYATTIFDYIRRAMPPDRTRRLSADETYALTAFVLAIGGTIGPDAVIDRESLPTVEMPNHDGFASPAP